MAIVSANTIAEDPMRWCEVVAMWVNVSNLPKLEVTTCSNMNLKSIISSFKCHPSYIQPLSLRS